MFKEEISSQYAGEKQLFLFRYILEGDPYKEVHLLSLFAPTYTLAAKEALEWLLAQKNCNYVSLQEAKS